MAKHDSKRLVEFRKKIAQKHYEPEAAFQLLSENSKAYESVDVVVVLGIDGKKSDQVVKGVVENLPAGLGRKISVGIFTKSDAKAALAVGADYAGFEDLFDLVKKETIDCDIYLATMEVMPELAKMGLGRILKGKMPNPRLGTVIEAANIEKAIKAQKMGQLVFRSNGSLVHCSIGRASFKAEDLAKNYNALIKTIAAVRPNAVKPHNYFKRIFVSSTMSPSVAIDLAASLKDIKV